MKPVISKCGNMCSSCPWGVWVRRNQTEEEWESYAAEVKKYVGFSVTKNPCHGCQTPTDKLAKDVGVHNFLRGCSARKCAFHNNIKNCSYCSRFPCDKIELMNQGKSRQNAETRIGEQISDDVYQRFVRIFEGKKNLEEIRSGLSPVEIKDVKTVEKKSPRITEFPKVEGKYTKYESLHHTIVTILTSEQGLKDTDTLAGQELLNGRRAILMRLLWIAATFGKIEKDRLIVDSILINTHKKGTSGFPTSEAGWLRYLMRLSREGIGAEMEFVLSDKSERTSPIGWLRDRIPGSDDPVWNLTLSFDEKLGGLDTLKLLHSYAKDIEEKFGKKAFSNFNKADMRLYAA
ncbi:MAG: DUF3795 domain-containing protein [Candidatus Thorarchaeota archaeon]